MRIVRKEGKLAALGAVLVALSACSPQCGPKTSSNPSPNASVVASTPSATATPTPTATPVTETPTPSSSATSTPTPAPLFITRQNIPLHVGEVGIGFAPATFGAVGGTPPYTWSIGGGALGPGLSLSTGGTVSGTPTASGSFGFTILLTDSAGVAAGYATSVSVLPHVALSGLCTQQCSVEAGCVTVCGAFSDISGGVQPYSFALTQGSIPAGMTLNGLALAGTFPAPAPNPNAAAPPPQQYTFTVGVTDALGATASVNSVFVDYPHVSLPSSGSCYGNFLTGCQGQLVISGGVPGSKMTATLVSVAPNPNPNPPNNNPGACWSSPPPSPPPSTPTVSAGNLVVNIPSGIGNGYGAIWTVLLDEQTPCAANTDCTSNQQTVVIGVQCS